MVMCIIKQAHTIMAYVIMWCYIYIYIYVHASFVESFSGGGARGSEKGGCFVRLIQMPLLLFAPMRCHYDLRAAAAAVSVHNPTQ